MKRNRTTMVVLRTSGTLVILTCSLLLVTGCNFGVGNTTNNSSNTNNGNCDGAGGSNSVNCSSVQTGASGVATATGPTVSSASAQASRSADVALSATPETEAPNLYIHTGTGTLAALQVDNREASGTSPAKISVPGGTIEDKYGSKIPLPTGCSYTNDNYPGWWVPYAASSLSRYAGLDCAIFQGRTASTIANVIVAVWAELPAPYTGSYVSQCLTYVTFSPSGSNPVGAYQNVSLYWGGTAWEDVPNVYGAWSEYCK